MRRKTRCIAFCLFAASAANSTASGQTETAATDVGSALTGGSVKLNLRYRHEYVDQDSFSDAANASTLRFRLNYRTDAWRGWTGFAEFDHVAEAGFDDFNSGQGTSSLRRARYPVVADPNGADFNQAYLQYVSGTDWQLRFGRQRVLLDDQRYVGGVGWRQNEQTYDGVSARYRGFADTTIFYSYVANVNRIFGSDVPAGDHRQETHLLNVDVALTDAWNVVGYAYVIDNEDAPAFSSETFGLRIDGQLKRGKNTIGLLAELAAQSDAGNNPARFDARYQRLQALWSTTTWSVGLGLEVLGADAGQGFRTPLATLHAFNGWADQFLATPAGGLEDLYLQLGYNVAAWNMQLAFHDFSAETGNADYGSEIDLSASRRFGNRYSLLLKAAAFDAADAPFVDTTKIWVMLNADF